MPDTILEGKTALVTGAGRGIGRVIAETLAQAGARVLGTATSKEGAQAIAERLGAVNPAGEGLVLDVASADSVVALGKAIAEMPADILVNNAGINRDNLLVRMKPEEWDDVIATDLTGVFR
ncbi:MAG: SDR family NAD(P)-dependent oxidoreductase, partial [Gammaproteobacteria bacterium]